MRMRNIAQCGYPIQGRRLSTCTVPKYRLSPAADRFNIMEFVAIKRVVRIATATDE